PERMGGIAAEAIGDPAVTGLTAGSAVDPGRAGDIPPEATGDPETADTPDAAADAETGLPEAEIDPETAGLPAEAAVDTGRARTGRSSSGRRAIESRGAATTPCAGAADSARTRAWSA